MLKTTPVFEYGSNAVRLKIYQSDSDSASTRIIKKETIMCGMGRRDHGQRDPDQINKKNLYAPGVKKALETTDWFCQIVRDPNLGVEKVVAVATAAIRSASDGGEFIQTLKDRFGLHVHVLSAEDEGMYGARGVLLGLPNADGLVADLGGGSMQLTQVSGGNTHATKSLPIGTFEALPHKDDLFSWLIPYFNALPTELSHTSSLYLIGGSWRTLAKIYLARAGRNAHELQGVTLDKNRLTALIQWLANLPDAEKYTTLTQDYYVDSDLVDSLLVAAPILMTLIDYVGADNIIISNAGVSDGAYREAIAGKLETTDLPQSSKHKKK